MNLTKWTKELCEELKFKNYAETTIHAYSICVAKFLQEYKHFDHPRRISEGNIKSYLKKAKSTSLLKQQIGALKFFYKSIVRQPLKFRYIEYPRKEKKLPIPLSLNEVQRLFDVCDNEKHKAILVTMYSTGVRISELLNLRVRGDINSEQQVIHVRGGKGNKDRQVPLDESLLSLLRTYYKAYKPAKYLFEGPNGRYSATSVRNLLKKYCKKAGIREIHPHLLRHSFGTHQIERGKDISILQRTLGHNSVKSTEIYTHISPMIIAKTGSPLQLLNI